MAVYEQVFVDIDTQVDFMAPAGRLYVPGAEQIVANLQGLFDYARQRGTPVISSADCHSPDDPEFGQFPPHCIADTDGQQKLEQTLLAGHMVIDPDQEVADLPALLAEHQQLVFNKPTFDIFSNPHADRLIGSLNVDRYGVLGVATDYCVRSAALGLLERGKQVVVVLDAVKPVDEKAGAAAEKELTRAGVRWCDSGEIMR
jgi:nicotinamidase/pyrazinamidase